MNLAILEIHERAVRRQLAHCDRLAAAIRERREKRRGAETRRKARR